MALNTRLNTKENSRAYFSIALPLLMGLGLFILVVGFGILNPRNVGWLLADFDMTLEYLGWAFYRYSPWTFPIGMNPNFGLDISSSIIFSNSLPIFAPIFKVFNPLLGEPFQFWGIWILLCFLLQAWIAWKLIGLMTSNNLLRFFASGLLAFSPSMLFQIGFHNSTVGHFPILAALYLIFRPQQTRRLWWWTLLLPCTLLIHPYTFAMILALWIADLLDRLFIQHEMRIKQVAKEILLVLSTTILLAWQMGYFMSVSPGETGFGTYRMNLLALFDSSGFDSQNWSYLFSLPQVRAKNNYEGFSYLGLGMILILLLALPVAVKHLGQIKQLSRRFIFVLLCLLSLTVFALSNQIAIGSWSFTVPLSPTLFSIASILRASGRMFWPVIYVISLASIYYLIKGYSKNLAISILGICLVIQVADTSNGWLPIRHKINHPLTQLESPLADPFWESAAKHYKKVVRVPVWNEQAVWEKFAGYAAQYHLGTNSVFMGRVDKNKIDASNAKLQAEILSGKFDDDTLYVVEDIEVPKFLATMNPSTDVLARFDQINVFAPKWKLCKDCLQINSKNEIDPKVSTARLIKLGEKIDLSRFGKYATVFLGPGWSVPENWGTWSIQKRASIELPLPAQNPSSLSIQGQAFVLQSNPKQLIEIYMNGRLMQKFTAIDRLKNSIVISIPKEFLGGEGLKIEFQFPDAVSPQSLGVGIDGRKLGLGIESIAYY